MKKIQLTQEKEAIVDDEDYEWLNSYKWFAHWDGYNFYACRNVKISGSKQRQTKISMHRVIMNPGDNMEVDHINHNGLDNQKENLRIVTHRQNLQNMEKIGSSKYPGVSWIKRDKKYQAKAQINGKNKHLGYFDSELEAFKVYKKAINGGI